MTILALAIGIVLLGVAAFFTGRQLLHLSQSLAGAFGHICKLWDKVAKLYGKLAGLVVTVQSLERRVSELEDKP